MNSLFRKITACLLLGAFSFILTPETLVHAFTGHEDTIDNYAVSGKAISPKHVHCESLQLQVQFFTETENTFLPAAYFHLSAVTGTPVQTYFYNSHFHTSLRGPPAIG